MALPLFLRAIEDSSISTWIRDSQSPFGFWLILTIHAIGMAILVGSSAVLDLRLLGVAPDLPIAPLKRLYPIIWFGFWVQVASGLLLMVAFPTKALTNPVFYLKLCLVGIGMVMMIKLVRRIFAGSNLDDDEGMMRKGRRLAMWSLVCWAAAMTAGRFLAYTAKYLVFPGGGS